MTACRRCRRPELPRMGDERPPHEQGAGVLRFRFAWGGGGSRRRQAQEQEPAACMPAVPAAGATACRRCRLTELLRMGDERPPHEQGAGILRFRFAWGGGGSRWRQAQEQEPAACGQAVPAAGATACRRCRLTELPREGGDPLPCPPARLPDIS